MSTLSKDVIALGERIVDELGLDETVDTLGRWMSHHIAGLMKAAETAAAVDRPARMAECAAAILELWRHRHQFPDGRRAFQGLEPVLRTLESLDPAKKQARYFATTLQAIEDAGANLESSQWLQLALYTDEIAKALIRRSLAYAAGADLDDSIEWVRLARAAADEEEVEFAVVRLLAAERDAQQEESPDEEKSVRLNGLLAKLDEFRKLANSLASDLRQRRSRRRRKA